MGLTLTEKIIKDHLVVGEMVKGTEIGIRIDQTLTQDSTGTMAYMQLEAMEVPRVKTKRSLAYIDHNMLQEGPENMDDHIYIQTVAKKHGVYFSKPGNGICHQVEIERFGVPGQTLLGSDSHTPTGGGIGMLAIGAGGLDVAVAMAGGEYYITMPEVVKVELTGKLRKGVSSKDIILEVLRQCTVKGGINKVFEYTGDGVKTLTVPERATVTNMGAELGATTSVFPSDEMTKAFLEAQGRGGDFTALSADSDAVYDQVVKVDLSTLEPLTACPHSPDKVVKVSEIEGLKVNQVAIGSCTNSSYMDMMSVAGILKNKTVDPNVSLVISPGSRQVLHMISQNGGLSDMISAGARILESTCGPCIGMGQSPITNALSLRTFNRNFYGRSGTLSAKVCLVSPETAAASALYGYIVDPRTVEYELPQEPEVFTIDDSMIIVPDAETAAETEVVRGPNIKPLPINTPLEDRIDKKVMIKVGDNITTDHIAPAGAKVLPYRSNIEKISEFIFMNVKASFHDDCLKHGGGFIIAGANYGQGSSREHAALAPMYLGIKAVIAKSFARNHRVNLINFGIIPFTFCNEEDYDTIDELDELTITNLKSLAEHTPVEVMNITKNKSFQVFHSLTQRDIETILAGGTLNLIRQNQS